MGKNKVFKVIAVVILMTLIFASLADIASASNTTKSQTRWHGHEWVRFSAYGNVVTGWVHDAWFDYGLDRPSTFRGEYEIINFTGVGYAYGEYWFFQGSNVQEGSFSILFP